MNGPMSVAPDIAGLRALLFDTFGTVVDWRTGVAREVGAFLAQHAIPGDPHDFADAWRARYQPAMEVIRRGDRPFTRLDVIHRENLEHVLASRGVRVDSIEPAALEGLTRAWHRLDPWPDSVPGLERLRQDYLVAPLSNGNIALLTNMAKRAGLRWDCILGAEVVRGYKPQPSVYVDTADVLGLRPDECMMVAAHNDDLAAAQAVGMRTAFILRPTEHGPAQTTDLRASGRWDFVENGFVDLAASLQAARVAVPEPSSAR